MSSAARPPEGLLTVRHLRLATLVAASLALAGCPPDGSDSSALRLRRPRKRLDRETQDAVMTLLDEMRGRDYVARVKAEEEIERRIRGEAPGGLDVVPYLVQLLDEPQWDVRAATFRLLMKYGFRCPEAVAALVQALGDMNMNVAVRDGAARSLARWTGESFGYDAWGPVVRIKASAKRWNQWLEETGGVITPQTSPAP